MELVSEERLRITLAASEQPTIVLTDRGLTIASIRITLYDVMDHLAAGWALKLILNWLPLSEAELNAALSYIDANRSEVEAGYRAVLQETQARQQYWEDKKSGWQKLPRYHQSRDKKPFMPNFKPGKPSSA